MKHIKIATWMVLTVLLYTSCQKEYSVEGINALNVPTGTWQFNDSSKLYAGNMDSAYIDSTSSPNTKILYLAGTSLDGSQNFQMILYSPAFTTGSYKASLFQSSFQYSSSGSTIYQAGQLIGEFIVNVTALSNTAISGTFSGSALNSSGQVIQITAGKFTSAFTKSGTNSMGVLGDSLGNCKPAILAGTYAPGIPLTGANTVQLQVTVASPGNYTIVTNTVNGVTFSKTGTFAAAGVQNVILTGNGTPLNSGNQIFTVSYGNSLCSFTINFESPAAGSLGGGGGNCTPFAIGGTYQQGIVLNATNTVQIQVNVTSPGNYSITTNSVNGVVFSNSGTFSNTGVQTVLLTGSGTPTNSGAQSFTVTFGTSNCSFSITFLPGVAPSGDYFPLTLNTNWTFGLQGGTTSDSIHTAVIGYTPTIGGNTYSTIALYNVPSPIAFDSAYYRKPGGDYYQYAIYSNVVPFDQQVTGEFIFLKDNVAAGTTWVSPNITGTIGGVAVTAYIKMTLLAKAVPVTIGPFSFPDVIKVQYEYFVTGIPNALETDERWFARNVGEVYNSANNGTTTTIYNVNTFQVF